MTREEQEEMDAQAVGEDLREIEEDEGENAEDNAIGDDAIEGARKDAQAAYDESVERALEKIPQNIMIKEKFVKHYQSMLGDKYDIFMKFSLSYIRKAIRVNTLKISVEDLKKRLEPRWNLTPIPWLKYFVLLNPLVYMSEGLRASLTPQLPHMPVWAFTLALIGGSFGLGLLALRTFSNRVVT